MHKEPEIVEYMTQNKITILGITDTRKKETGTQQIYDNFVLIWSGVRREDRAKHGAGFVIHHEKAKDLVHTEFISERLLKIAIREGNKINNYIQVYAPCNDSYSDEEKDNFFEHHQQHPRKRRLVHHRRFQWKSWREKSTMDKTPWSTQ